ncbi:MAG: hypothetical protein M3R54_09370, partial [Chloroflexota bacterium]|nr:hypothetical protein [Chloroflexota bacterium]
MVTAFGRATVLALTISTCATFVPQLRTAAPSAASSVPAATATIAAAPSAVAFDGARAREHVTYLADPARGGRFTGSSGFEDAARYVADRYREIGLEPAGDNGTFFQRFPVQIVDLAGTPTLTRTGSGAKSWVHRVDFTESVGGRAGSGSAEATLAVVG